MSTERCVCGAAVQDLMAAANEDLPPEDRHSAWVHVPGSDTRCIAVRLVSQLDEHKLAVASAEQLAELSNRTRRAAGELERFQSALAELADEARDLHRSLDMPMAIRRATLRQVWHRMLSAGCLDGANLVREMMMELKGAGS